MSDSSIGTISELKVMKSAAGYYIGRSYFDTECQCDFPYDRQGEYHATAEDAQAELDYLDFCEEATFCDVCGHSYPPDEPCPYH